MGASAAALRTFRWPQTVICRFVARRTVRSAALWALVFGVFVASKASGYAAAFPTLQSREAAAATYGSNIGFKMLVGRPEHLEQVPAFTVWNSLMVITLIAAIWAFLLASKTFRGEESNGRWELLLAGQTTARRATANALGGLGVSLAVMYAVSALGFIVVGRLHTVDYSLQAALFFALCTTVGAAMFMAIGALMSQLMPTRSRAASMTALIFGICFLVRATADSTTQSWLLNLSPLGWIEKLRPLYASDPIWLIPCGVVIAGATGAAIFLAGKRDLGDSLLADTDAAKPRLRFLGSPLAAAFRVTRVTNAAWLGVIVLVAFFFGTMSKTAAEALSSSVRAEKLFGQLAHSTTVFSQRAVAAEAFLGIVFMLAMVLLMCYVSSAASAMREDEAQGYLDNLLVRPVGRLQWLAGRVTLVLGVVLLCAALAGMAAWAGQATQHLGLSFGVLWRAGLNIAAPVLLTLGIGIAALGFAPRFTSLLAYGVVAWSFLVTMISSGVHLSHWLLDTSVLQHVSFAPAASPNWKADAILIVIAVALAALGAARFRGRDLQSE
ncbi:MAG TPA: ABC transporter permease subunit [Candidatus Saccharimonadales bacterium]|nr:ABC transporter permease subunit [Candidatus Saccharimonadales bacterium]